MLPQSKRLLSIDVFRAINMFFMIFVNDLSGVRNVPGWIDHVKDFDDGMHFADTIFPLFLFIAGLSIPLAIGRRLSKNESFQSIAWYIVTRSFALIVMGFFHVNMEEYSSAALLPLGVWMLLLTISFFLIWLDYPKDMAKKPKYSLIGLGVMILIVLAAFYKGGTPANPVHLHPSWWGILGIIGWSYLVCAGVYLLSKGKLSLLCTALAFLVLVNLVVHGHFHKLGLWFIGDGASAGLMMFGVVTSVIYQKMIVNNNFKRVWPVFTASGIALIVLGFVVRPYTQGISKIHSTPAWVFICTGIGVLFFELMIWLIDIKKNEGWFKVIRPAGTSTLTCYLIPYLMVAIFYITHFRYPEFLNSGAGGIIRSFAICFIIIAITGLLEKRRLRLKI